MIWCFFRFQALVLPPPRGVPAPSGDDQGGAGGSAQGNGKEPGEGADICISHISITLIRLLLLLKKQEAGAAAERRFLVNMAIFVW